MESEPKFYHGIRQVEILGGGRYRGNHEEIEVKFKDGLVAWVRESEVYTKIGK